jgi:hypothetical protein
MRQSFNSRTAVFQTADAGAFPVWRTFLPSSFNQQDLALVTRRSRGSAGRWLQIIAEWDNSSPPVSETGRSWCKSKLSSSLQNVGRSI